MAWETTEMGSNFDDLFAEIEAEAKAEGPAAVRDLRAKQLKYSLVNALISGRQARRLTQAQLSERSGIAQTEISRIERGRKSPTIDTYARIAAALELELPAGWRPSRKATWSPLEKRKARTAGS
jgi:DNA-binding XRE family transcriptional regulator